MSFLGMGLYRLLRRSGLSFLPAGAAGGSFLTVYDKMIGASASGIRALCMYLVRIGSEVTGRTYDMAISLAVASIVTIALHPLYTNRCQFFAVFRCHRRTSALQGAAFGSKEEESQRPGGTFVQSLYPNHALSLAAVFLF